MSAEIEHVPRRPARPQPEPALGRRDLRVVVHACQNYGAYLRRRTKGIDPEVERSLSRAVAVFTALADRMHEREQADAATGERP